MTIQNQILGHLQSGKLLNMAEAQAVYGYTLLPVAIHRLRKLGHNIKTRKVSAPTGKTYSEYYIPRGLAKGDRVRASEDSLPWVHRGDTGTVLLVDGDGTTRVKWDTKRQGDNRWWITTERLEILHA